jgi:hypothetical protein
MLGNGLLSDEEIYLLKRLVKSWHECNLQEQTKVETRLSELILGEILTRKPDLTKWIETAICRLDENLAGKLNQADRTVSINNICKLVQENPKFIEANAEE